MKRRRNNDPEIGRPIEKSRYRLEDLVAGITPANRHPEVSWGDHDDAWPEVENHLSLTKGDQIARSR